MITAVCSNPQDMKITVTVDLPLREWKVILEYLQNVQYYAPLRDIQNGISGAISDIENRSALTNWKTEQETPPKRKK